MLVFMVCNPKVKGDIRASSIYVGQHSIYGQPIHRHPPFRLRSVILIAS